MITETDVANKILQRCGATRILAGSTLYGAAAEDSKGADEIRTTFDITRRFELRRNVWRFSIRTEVLRPWTSTTYVVIFPVWDARVNYRINDRVRVGTDSWMNIKDGINLNPADRDYSQWVPYLGADSADLYDATVTYFQGEYVYENDVLYISIAPDNLGNAVTDTAYWTRLSVEDWAQFTIYEIGDRVVLDDVTYVSLTASNQNKSPDANPSDWAVTTSMTLAAASYTIPTQAGVNLYRLPTGFMREAPQDPKRGSYMPLGAPSAGAYSDLIYEGNHFLSFQAGPFHFRHVADIMSPDDWDPMFLNGYSCAAALEVCEPITQSTGKLKNISSFYDKFMSEARTVNAIEQGPVESPEDSYITSRY